MTEINTDSKLDFSQQLEKIFEERALDVRQGLYVVLATNILFQMLAFRTLGDPRQLAVQSVYWVFTLFTTVFTGLSYRPGRLLLIKYGFVILIIRNTIRLYNFENSEPTYLLVILQQITCLMLLQSYVIYFERSKENERFKILLFIVWAVA